MRPWGVATVFVFAACAQAPPGPAPLDTRNEWCSSCRMAVSDARFAAQLVAPSEEPRFFDDIGCLRSYLEASRRALPGAVTYVADHGTKAWVAATHAVYTRAASLETPMGSRILAHSNAASRDADPDAKDGALLGLAEVFGPGGPPGGSR